MIYTLLIRSFAEETRNMATSDIRFKRMDKEYLSLRESQGTVFDKVDGFEGALLGLTEMVAENREMLLAIIKNLEIPYDRPPMGFSQ